MDVPCKIQGNIHILLCLIHKINVSRILGTYHFEYPFLILIRSIIISERIFLLIHCILHCKLRSVSGS